MQLNKRMMDFCLKLFFTQNHHSTHRHTTREDTLSHFFLRDGGGNRFEPVDYLQSLDTRWTEWMSLNMTRLERGYSFPNSNGDFQSYESKSCLAHCATSSLFPSLFPKMADQCAANTAYIVTTLFTTHNLPPKNHHTGGMQEKRQKKN